MPGDPDGSSSDSSWSIVSQDGDLVDSDGFSLSESHSLGGRNLNADEDSDSLLSEDGIERSREDEEPWEESDEESLSDVEEDEELEEGESEAGEESASADGDDEDDDDEEDDEVDEDDVAENDDKISIVDDAEMLSEASARHYIEPSLISRSLDELSGDDFKVPRCLNLTVERQVQVFAFAIAFMAVSMGLIFGNTMRADSSESPNIFHSHKQQRGAQHFTWRNDVDESLVDNVNDDELFNLINRKYAHELAQCQSSLKEVEHRANFRSSVMNYMVKSNRNLRTLVTSLRKRNEPLHELKEIEPQLELKEPQPHHELKEPHPQYELNEAEYHLPKLELLQKMLMPILGQYRRPTEVPAAVPPCKESSPPPPSPYDSDLLMPTYYRPHHRGPCFSREDSLLNSTQSKKPCPPRRKIRRTFNAYAVAQQEKEEYCSRFGLDSAHSAMALAQMLMEVDEVMRRAGKNEDGKKRRRERAPPSFNCQITAKLADHLSNSVPFKKALSDKEVFSYTTFLKKIPPRQCDNNATLLGCERCWWTSATCPKKPCNQRRWQRLHRIDAAQFLAADAELQAIFKEIGWTSVDGDLPTVRPKRRRSVDNWPKPTKLRKTEKRRDLLDLADGPSEPPRHRFNKKTMDFDQPWKESRRIRRRFVQP